MFQSRSSPDNQCVISGQGLYDSEPHPHWPQFCPPHPSGAIRNARSQCPYGEVYTRPPAPFWRQSKNMWKVGYEIIKYHWNIIKYDKYNWLKEEICGALLNRYQRLSMKYRELFEKVMWQSLINFNSVLCHWNDLLMRVNIIDCNMAEVYLHDQNLQCTLATNDRHDRYLLAIRIPLYGV